MDSVVDVIDLSDENAWASELFTKSPAENVVSMFTPRGVYILASIERKLWNNIVAYKKKSFCNVQRISAFKTWWKNQKIRKSKFCLLF